MHSVRLLLVIATMSLSCRAIGQWLDISADTAFFNERMFFNSATKGTVVGLDGIYQRTFDGGITWDTGYIALDSWSLCIVGAHQCDLRSIFFPTDTIGYIGGANGDLFKTNNGGLSWYCLTNVGMWDDLTELYFFDNDTGLCATWYQLWRTTDGGQSWNSLPPFGPTRMTPVNDSTILAGGAKIWRSSDYGATWSATNCDTTIGFHDISMGDSLNGVAVSWAGKIIRTTDGGLNWTTPVQIATVRISNVEMLNDSFGFISLGDSWETNWPQYDIGYVMYTLDGGITWIQPDTIGTKTLTDLAFPSDSIGYGCSWLGNLLKTEHPVRPFSGVGIEELKVHSQPILYPNPTQGVLHVLIPGATSTTDATFMVSDISGRVLRSEQNISTAPYEIDVALLSSGVYMLHCTVNGVQSISKFVVR